MVDYLFTCTSLALLDAACVSYDENGCFVSYSFLETENFLHNQITTENQDVIESSALYRDYVINK